MIRSRFLQEPALFYLRAAEENAIIAVSETDYDKRTEEDIL